LLLVLQDNDLWSAFSEMNTPQRLNAMDPDSSFMSACHSVENFQPFAGDHTRLAAAELMRNFPRNPKWKIFKEVSIYLCDDSEESADMLRNLGNMNNTIAHTHKALAFADKVRQIHTYMDQQGLLVDAANLRVKNSAKTKPFLAGLATTWGMPLNSMNQLVAVAKLSGAAWDGLDQILAGQYRLPGAKAIGGPPPKAVSYFLSLGAVPLEVQAGWFQDIIDGKLDLKKLGDTANRWKVVTALKKYIISVAALARPNDRIKTWEQLRTLVPAVCTQAFLNSWIPSIKVKGDKMSDPPAACKDAIINFCQGEVLFFALMMVSRGPKIKFNLLPLLR
jgi:hypothetical protein